MYTPILFVNLINLIHWKINMVKHEQFLGFRGCGKPILGDGRNLTHFWYWGIVSGLGFTTFRCSPSNFMVGHDDFPIAIRLFSEETKMLELLLLVNVLEVVLETVLLLLVTLVEVLPRTMKLRGRC
jgi:hypothetical protein